MQRLFLDHIDVPSKSILEIRDQPAWKERSGIGPCLDQKVGVTVRPRLRPARMNRIP